MNSLVECSDRLRLAFATRQAINDCYELMQALRGLLFCPKPQMNLNGCTTFEQGASQEQQEVSGKA